MVKKFRTKKKVKLEKKLFYFAMKKYFKLKKIDHLIFIKIFLKFNFFQSIFIFYKILQYSIKK